MPKVWITLDDIDGTSRVRGPFYPDEIDTMGLLLRLNSRDLATVTFTNAEPLKRIRELAEQHKCLDCGAVGYSGWNCQQCGSNNITEAGQ